MPDNSKLDAGVVAKIHELNAQGKSTREIGKELEIHHSTVGKYLKKNPDSSTPVEAPPVETELNTIVDRSQIDGKVDLLTLDRPANPDELFEMCGLDREVWRQRDFKEKVWQSFYKLKNYIPDKLLLKLIRVVENGGGLDKVKEELERSEYGHQKVQMYGSQLSVERVVKKEHHEAVKRFMERHVKAIPKSSLKKAPKSKADREPFALAWGLWDAHVGMYAWGDEVGESFDLSMAISRICNSVDRIIEELQFYNIEKIFMPVGNDFLHFDSVRMKTTMGDHFLDTDTRYAKVYEWGFEALAYMVERALEICDDVDLCYIPGNHDYTAGHDLTHALKQRYWKDKRVAVDTGPNPRKYRTYGGCLLGFDHGKLKADRYPIIMSTEAKELWANATYREMQVGHTHQRREIRYDGVVPTNGVLVRVNPTLCNIDAWHHANGFTGEPMKSIEAWRYDKTGYRGSHVAWAQDEQHGVTKSLKK